jgi:hypothetical protein
MGLSVQSSMGEIFVARGKTACPERNDSGTKECRPGYERTKENRPRKSVFQCINFISDGTASAFKNVVT